MKQEGWFPSYYLASDIHSYGVPLMVRRLFPRVFTASMCTRIHGSIRILFGPVRKTSKRNILSGAIECFRSTCIPETSPLVSYWSRIMLLRMTSTEYHIGRHTLIIIWDFWLWAYNRLPTLSIINIRSTNFRRIKQMLAYTLKMKNKG